MGLDRRIRELTSTTKQPRVTVGITCFNAQDTIGRCIESATKQQWPDLDILVVDDCSTDGSIDVIRCWCDRDERIRLVTQQKNLGAGAARHTLLEESYGDYVVFFDDDDVSAPNRTSVQLERIKAARDSGAPAPILCYATGCRVYDNAYVKSLPAIGSRGFPVCGGDLAAYLLANERIEGCFYGAGTPACALMVARSEALAIGGFDPGFRRVEDLDFAVRAGKKGGCAIGTQDSLFTQFATQSADKSAYINYQSELHLVHKHQGFLKDRGQYGSARRWFGVRYYYFTRRWPYFGIALVLALFANPVRVMRRVTGTAPVRILHDIRRIRRKKG